MILLGRVHHQFTEKSAYSTMDDGKKRVKGSADRMALVTLRQIPPDQTEAMWRATLAAQRIKCIVSREQQKIKKEEKNRIKDIVQGEIKIHGLIMYFLH